MKKSEMRGESREMRRLFRIGATVVLLGAAVLSLIYILSFILIIIPVKYYRFEIAATVFIVIIMVMISFRRFLKGTFSGTRHINGYRAAMYLVNTLSYFILAVAVLYSLGINVYSVFLGSTLLAAVLALGAQSILGNIFSGILLVVTRPVKINDTVWIFPWNSSSALIGLQFGIFLPKYFSADYLYAQGIVGKIKNITLNYLTIENESGQVSIVPNIIVAVGAFLIISDNTNLSLRYELPKYTSLNLVRNVMGKILEEMGMKCELNLQIDETTLDTYVLRISIKNNEFNQLQRTAIMEMINSRIDSLREAST